MLILIGLLLTLGWLALGLHYVITFVGLESISFLPPYEVGLIAAGLFGPVALIWCIVVTLRSPGRAKRLEQQVEVLIEQIALLRQAAGGDVPETVPSKDAAESAGSASPDRSQEEKAGQAAPSGRSEKAEPALAGGGQAEKSPAASSEKASSPVAAEAPKTASTQTASSKSEAPKDVVAAAREERAANKQQAPRPSPLTDGLPPFKAGKDEPKDGELIYDILRRSVRDHLNDTAMDIAAVLSAREAYSEALTKLRQGGRGSFFELVAKDLREGGESASARLDRLNAWPMLETYREDYGRLLEAAGGKDTKLGALIEKSELGQLGAAVTVFVEQAKAGQDKGGSAAGGTSAGAGVNAGSAATESAMSAPGKADPGKAEPGKPDTGKAEPGKPDSGKAEPEKTELAKAENAGSKKG